jgi:pimeloyl-ACP methyl ester carboxylesterase
VTPRSSTFSSTQPGSPRLHFLSWGDERKPKLVLLHGGGSNAHWWDHVAPHFCDDFHVIALDFRGHGISEYPEELKVGAFNDDLEMLTGFLGTDAISIIGHSMGSHVAVDHASRHPATKALVLVDISRGAGRASRRRSRLALRLKGTYSTREIAIERFQFLPPADYAEEALRHDIADKSVHQQPDGRYTYAFDPRWFNLGSRPPPDLGNVHCPTLILRGDESKILTAEGAISLEQELPDARLEVVEKAGHHIHIDRPEETIQALKRFLLPPRA